MKYLCLLALFALTFSCHDATPANNTAVNGEAIKLPPPRKVKVENGQATFIDDDGKASAAQPATRTATKAASNDLNGDGEPDRLEVVTTTEDNDGLGFKRQLVVYSGEGADLDAWYTADEVILSTEHGGAMGDPLQGVDIEDGTIIINHFGGSRQKWNYTNRFQWQEGDFKLIGTTITFGAPCDAFTTLDYNLSTGKAVWEKETEDCEDENAEPVSEKKEFRNKIQPPSMNGFLTGQHEIKIPDTEESVYY